MWDALESCQNALGHSHASTIEWLENLCKLYVLLNNTPKACFMALTALNACMSVLGECHVSTLAALERYASLCRASGQLMLSRELFEQCLQLRILTQGDDAASTSITRAALNEVQMLCITQIQIQEAAARAQEICELEVLGTQALRADDVHGALHALAACFEIAKDIFGPDSMPAARAAASYGFVLLHSKQFQMSQVLLHEAVIILQRNLGRGNKEVLVCISALARSLVGIGDLRHAEETLCDCLDQCELSLGLHDKFSLKIMWQLGQLYSMIDGKLQTARKLLQECFSHSSNELHHLMAEPLFPDDSTDSEYFEVLDDLVNILVKLDEMEFAEMILQQAYESHIKRYGCSHASTLEATSRLARALVLMGNALKAVPLFEHVLYTQSMVLGSTSHATLRAAEDLASAHEALSQFYVAELLLSFSVIHKRTSPLHSSSEFSAILVRLALTLQKAGKYESALLCFLEILEGKSSNTASYHCVAVTAAENAGFCFMKMGIWQRARLMFSYCVQAYQITPNSHLVTQGTVQQHMRFCLSNLGIVSVSEGNLAEAEQNFMACLSLNLSGLSTEKAVDDGVADVSWNLAIVYQASGKFSQSESLFLKCIEAHERVQDFCKALDAKHSLALLYWWVLCVFFE
jgi:tetratricopeptide (TPR) repeat protein